MTGGLMPLHQNRLPFPQRGYNGGVMSEVIPGDIIGFSGDGVFSTVIKLGTFSHPWSGVSHVGIVAGARAHGNLVFESLATDSMPCKISGECRPGVQAHTLEEICSTYQGWVYHYPLYRPLYRHESSRLTSYLLESIGKYYDEIGAMRTTGFLYAAISALKRGQDTAELFCSELVVASLSHIGLWATTNVSRWNPTRLIRSLRCGGLVCKPRRLK